VNNSASYNRMWTYGDCMLVTTHGYVYKGGAYPHSFEYTIIHYFSTSAAI